MELVALVLFVGLVAAWMVLPNPEERRAKKVTPIATVEPDLLPVTS